MIFFENWNLRVDGQALAQQFDHLTRTVTVVGDIPAGWDWVLLVQVGEFMDMIPLAHQEGILSTVLTAQQLSVAGYYKVQLRGVRGEQVKHTNIINVYISESLSGAEKWPEVPSEFTELERSSVAAAKKAETAAAAAQVGAGEAKTAADAAVAAKAAAQNAAANASQSAKNAAASEQTAAQHKAGAEKAVLEAEGYTLNPPTVGEDGNWFLWDGEKYVDSGKPSQGKDGYTPVKGVDYFDGAPGELTRAQGNTLYANALKGTASGVAIRVDDVSPLEHNVSAKVRSKNLYSNADYGFINGKTVGLIAAKTDTGYSLTGSCTNSCFVIVPVGSLAELGGETITKSHLIRGNGRIEYVICASDCSNRTTLYASDTTIVPQASEYPDGYILALRLYGDLNGDPSAVVTYDNIQVELGTTATTYEPYRNPASIVLRAYGKNLLDVRTAGTYHANSASPLAAMTVTETGMRLECVRAHDNPWVSYGFCLGTVEEFVGKTITLYGNYSSGMTTTGAYIRGNIIGTNIEPTPAGKDPIYANGGYIGATGTTKTFSTTPNGPVTYTVTGEEEWKYIGVSFYFVCGGPVAIGDVVEISNIQVELGDTATGYESYKSPAEYTPAEDGTCEVTSVAPIMTLLTDNRGAIMDCEYNKDINKAYDQLVQAIISMGGNI